MNSPRCRVLLIEDDPSMRGFLRSMMASHGYALTEAGTAADGMRSLPQ